MRKLLSVLVAAVFGLTVGACDEQPQPTTPEPSAARGGMAGPPTPVLEITAVHGEEGPEYAFEASDDEIPSGWTTIELDNETEATHFAFLRKATPEFLAGMRADHGEVSAQAFLDAASIPFQEAWDPYFEGDVGFGAFLGNLVAGTPAWFSEHRPIGGPGLTSGGLSSRTTQYLEPGTYFVECYVLGENGQFHTLGMIEKLEVTEATTDAREPRPTMRVSIFDDGFEIEDAQGTAGIRPGQQTIAVTFEENGTQSGNDLHLIRLDDGTTVAEVNAWMDWPDIGPDGFYDTDAFGPALTSYHDAPGPQTWLGGVQDIRPPLPETAYFHVHLKPGEYAFVGELPSPNARGFLKTFTVPFGTSTG